MRYTQLTHEERYQIAALLKAEHDQTGVLNKSVFGSKRNRRSLLVMNGSINISSRIKLMVAIFIVTYVAKKNVVNAMAVTTVVAS